MMPEIDRDTVSDIISGAHAPRFDNECLLSKDRSRLANRLQASIAENDVNMETSSYVYCNPLTIPPAGQKQPPAFPFNNSKLLLSYSNNINFNYDFTNQYDANNSTMTNSISLNSKEKLENLLKFRESHSTATTIEARPYSAPLGFTGTTQFPQVETPNAHWQTQQQNLGASSSQRGIGEMLPNNSTAARMSAPPPPHSFTPPPRIKTPHPTASSINHSPNRPEPNISATANSCSQHLETNISLDSAPATWHEHVYARPPNRPTPHAVADILGWRLKTSQSPTLCTETHKNSNNTVVAISRSTDELAHLPSIDESSNSSLPNATPKSPKSILRTFQQQLSQQQQMDCQRNDGATPVLSTSMSETSEDEAVTGLSLDQPLNLCVAKKPNSKLTTVTMQKLLITSKTSKSGATSDGITGKISSKMNKKDPALGSKSVMKKKKLNNNQAIPAVVIPVADISPAGSDSLMREKLTLASSATPPASLATTVETTEDDSDSGSSDARRKKKARTTFTGRQIFELEKQFEIKKYLSSSERTEMAKLLNVTETQKRTFWARHINCR